MEVPEFITDALSKAAQSDLASYLVVVSVVWTTMGKKVASHFKGLETSVVQMAEELRHLRTDLHDGLRSQANRLDAHEAGMVQLQTRVNMLEESRGNHGGN